VIELFRWTPGIYPGQTKTSMSSPQGHSLLWASTCSGVLSSTGCRWISAPLWTPWAAEGQPASPLSGCRGISAPVPGAPPPPPSSVTLVSAKLFLSHFLTPLCFGFCCGAVFSPSICYHRGATTVYDAFGLGQRQVRLGADWY